jgi:pentatricopeptide repeat protein
MRLDFDSKRNKKCRPNVLTYNTLLNALHKSNIRGAPEKAEDIFSFIRSPDTVTYNTMIKIYVQHGEYENARFLAEEMDHFESGENKNCCPDMHTYNTILNDLQISTRYNAAEIAEVILNSIPSPDIDTYTNVLSIYLQKDKVEKAMTLVKRMQMEFDSGKTKKRTVVPLYKFTTLYLLLFKKKLRSDYCAVDKVEPTEQFFNCIPLPNTTTYNTLANIYAEYGKSEKALNLIRRMRFDFGSGKNKDCRPDVHSYNTALQSFRNSDRADDTKRAEQFFKSIPLPDRVSYNALLDVFVEKGEIEKATRFVQRVQLDFDSGKCKDCCPDTHTYNTY